MSHFWVSVFATRQPLLQPTAADGLELLARSQYRGRCCRLVDAEINIHGNSDGWYLKTRQEVVGKSQSGLQVSDNSYMHLLESQLSRVRQSQDGVAHEHTSMNCGPSQKQTE